MDNAAATAALTALHISDAAAAVSGLADGATALVRALDGPSAALLRRGDAFDVLIVGGDAECPVRGLRAILDTAVLPLSDQYARHVGVALAERDALRKRIREASAALDVLSKGRLVRVAPVDMQLHPDIVRYAGDGAVSADELPDELAEDLSTLNQLQSHVVAWTREIDRVVQVSLDGPGGILSAEEESVFWSSLDAALAAAQLVLAGRPAKISLELLARKRRCTGFLSEATRALETGRRKASSVLNLVQGLPIVALRTAEDIPALLSAINGLLDHVAAKLRISLFPIERALCLVDSMGDEVVHVLRKILQRAGGLLKAPYDSFLKTFEGFCDVFEAWAEGYDHCRKVAREAAKSNSEKMPPRRKTSLSSLQSYIAEVYEFRSDHDALHALLTHLAVADPQSTRRRDELDVAYVSVMEATRAKDDDGEELTDNATDWAEARTAYSVRVASIEESVTTGFITAVQETTDLNDLAKIVAPYKLLLDRSFMSSVTDDAVPIVLKLARSDLHLIRQRQLSSAQRLMFPVLGDVPKVCSTLIDSRMMIQRLETLLQNTAAVVGSVKMESLPDMRELATEVATIRAEFDASFIFSEWLDNVPYDSFRSSRSLFSCPPGSDEHSITLSVPDSEAEFFKVIRVIGQDSSLSHLLSPSVVKFARSSKDRYPTHAALSQALRNYQNVSDCLKNMHPLVYQRVYPLIKEQRQAVRVEFEMGIKMQWSNPQTGLNSYASQLGAAVGELSDSLAFAVEHDNFLEDSIGELYALRPHFSGSGRLSDSDAMCIQSCIKCVHSSISALLKRFSYANSVQVCVQENWIPTTKFAVLDVLDQALRAWTDSLQSGTLLSTSVKLKVSTGERKKVVCEPSLQKVEIAIYRSLGDLLHTVFGSADISETAGLPLADGLSSISLYSTFANVSPSQDAKKSLGNCFRAVVSSMHAMRTVKYRWERFIGYLSLDQQELQLAAGTDLEQWSGFLSAISVTRSDLHSFREECLSATTLSSCGVELDANDVYVALNSALAATMDGTFRHCAVAAASESQALYQTVSDAKTELKSAAGGNGIEILLLLKSVQDDVLSACCDRLAQLGDLEKVLQTCGDNELPDDWISYEALEAQFSTLHDLHGQRARNMRVNQVELENKFQQRKSIFHSRLSEVYGDMETFRSSSTSEKSDEEDDTSIRAMDALESRLFDLKSESDQLARIGDALQVGPRIKTTELEAMMEELLKAKEAFREILSIRSTLDAVGAVKFSFFDPSTVQETLQAAQDQLESIVRSSGLTREAVSVLDNVKRRIRAHDLLERLHSCALSPPRERDLGHRLFKSLGSFTGLGNVPLQRLWDVDLVEHESYLRKVFDGAAGEAALSNFLSSISQAWCARKGVYFARDGVRLLQGIPAILDDLAEHLQALSTMAGSPYARLFESDRGSWEMRLARCRDELELLSDVQTRWLHLHSLFGETSGSSLSALRKELRNEFAAFSNVHARFAEFSARLVGSPGILEGLEKPSGLDRMSADVTGIVRGLSKFLERQRSRFPRFFFLSDQDLLLVLAVNSTSLSDLTPHMSKLFSGISSLVYDEADGSSQTASITGAISQEGELLELASCVSVRKDMAVTDWLSKLDRAIAGALKCYVPSAAKSVREVLFGSRTGVPESEVYVLLSSFPTQILLLATKNVFTCAVDESFATFDTKGAGCTPLDNMLVAAEERLRFLCCIRAGVDNQDIQGERKHRIALAAREQLIKELVYQRDTIRSLCVAGARTSHHPAWSHQVRVYVLPSQNAECKVYIRCADAELEYGWEYLGVGEALVQTPLTSQCFLTMTQALKRGLGGSPFGPAGTGKTETVKALGRILGRFVAVFNCDESFDAVAVGRILAGACRVGSWVCFDEFNRLSAGILSATSGQLVSLQAAIQAGRNTVDNFYGGELSVDVEKGVGVFVTMNPTYAGRRELPANLKSLFRPCAMSKPDSIVIAEVLLLSQGFLGATDLAGRLVCLFESLSQTLQPQPHYDFGLRSMKSAIVSAGALRQSLVTDREAQHFEEMVVVRALIETLKPKLVPADVRDFTALIRNLFRETHNLSTSLPDYILKAVRAVAEEKVTHLNDLLLEKIGQLYDLLEHHSGIMLVGPAGCGKSVTWGILREALQRSSSAEDRSGTRRSGAVSVTILDPKLLTTKQLYGSMDPTTREWTDGLFTKTLRFLNAPPHGASHERDGSGYHWIVFDGDIDPDWAENLNSVLDDNRLLTLPSGERIPLPRNTRILFETEDLRHANPSTVSRCGMVCFEDQQAFEAIANCFLERMCNDKDLRSSSLLQDVMPLIRPVVSVSRSIHKFGKQIMRVSTLSLLSSVMTMFSNALSRFALAQGKQSSEHDVEVQPDSPGCASIPSEVLIRCFLSCAASCLGSGLHRVQQRSLSQALVQQVDRTGAVDLALEGLTLGSTLCEVSVDSQSGEFVSFTRLVTNDSENRMGLESLGSPDVVISTPTTVRLQCVLSDVLGIHQSLCGKPGRSRPVILCGPPGCGKSMLLNAALEPMPNVDLVTMSFSSQTGPDDILAALRGNTNVSKRPNGDLVMSPKAAGYRVVLFCDEVNLGQPDKYETQSAVAMLRSLVEHHGFWSGSPPEWVTAEGLQVVAACNPSEDAGRHVLPPRFLRHCNIVRVEQPDDSDLHVIYSAFVASLLSHIHPQLEEKTESLTGAMIDFFSANKEQFAPIGAGPAEPHYVYSPRELSRWIRGMKHILQLEKSSPEDVISGARIDLSVSSQRSWQTVQNAFCHEARRLFCDRLLSDEEHRFAEMCLLRVAQQYLGLADNEVPDPIYSSWLSDDDDGANGTSRLYKLVPSLEQFRDHVYQRLRVFAEEEGLGGSWMSGSGAMQIDEASTVIDQFAVTDDVLKHLVRIERILRLPLGHAVLMGAPGTGKKTLARFAAWMSCIQVHQVRSHSSYTAQDFAKDLRGVLRRAGVDGCRIMMIFDESNAFDSAFLEMMNSILACGDVPGLFSGEERSGLLADIRDKRGAVATSTISNESLYADFVGRVRSNLHVLFTISGGCGAVPLAVGATERVSGSRVGGDLGTRSPALYNRCTVDWIGDWDAATLEAVAELKVEVSLGKEKDQIIRSAVRMHEIARKHLWNTAGGVCRVTPRHYLEFMEQLNRITLEKADEIQEGAGRVKEGLGRLRTAGDAVDELKDVLADKAEQLSQKEQEANRTLRQMAEEQRQVEKAKVDAEQLAIAAAEAAQAARERENEVAEHLATVEPKIEAARDAVGSIRREFLEELRGMPNPPAGVRIALEGVMMVLDAANKRNESSYTWSTIRSRMRGTDFIASVVNFNAESLPSDLRKKIETTLLDNPDFDAERISYASRAAGPLAAWTLAVLDYAAVKDAVEPLREEVRDLQEEQEELLQREERAMGDVAGLEDRIENFRSEYALLVAGAERVRQQIKDSESNLTRAEEMLDSLAEEWNRWVADLNSFNEAAVHVWGNSVLSSAFVAYAGALDHAGRKMVCAEWLSVLESERIPFKTGLRIHEFLTTSRERALWTDAGLAVDDTSLESYAILKRSARYPLVVDPSRKTCDLVRSVLGTTTTTHGHANARQDGNGSAARDETSPIRITSSSFSATGRKSYMRALESAMRFGTSIVLEDANKFDHAVAPLLGQESSYGDAEELAGSMANAGKVGRGTARSGLAKRNVCQRMVRLGERDVGMSPTFRMFLSVTDVGLVPAAAISRSCVVSFAMSPATMEMHCVSRAMQGIVPEIEERRKESISVRLAFQQRKLLLEESVLATITKAEDLGDGLLNGTLLEILGSLKAESLSVRESEEEALAMSQDIERHEALYRPLAVIAVKIHEVLEQLSCLNVLYQFSADFMLSVFDQAVRSALDTCLGEQSPSVGDIRDKLFANVYSKVVPCLFPRDKLPFAAALAMLSHDQSSLAIKDVSLIQHLVDDAIANNTDGSAALSMFLEKLPASLQSVLPIEQLQDKTQNVASSPLDAIGDLLTILHSFIHKPSSLSGKIDNIASTLPGGHVYAPETRADVTLRAIVSEFASESNRDPSGMASEKLYRPLLLCGRGQGVDPSALASSLASEYKVQIASVAIGNQHDADSISDVLSASLRRTLEEQPLILLLKNMHLASASCVERLGVEVLKRGGLLPYLLVVSCEVGEDVSRIPASGLASSFRVFAFEAPPSFRTNLSRCKEILSTAASPIVSPVVARARVVVAWLHATLLERALYTPIGFSRAYDFSEADLYTAWEAVETRCTETPDVAAIVHMLATSVYGCRVEQDSDYEVLHALVEDLFARARIGDATEDSVCVADIGLEGRLRVPIAEPQFREFVRTLPLEAPCEWFGMPPGAHHSRHVREGREMTRVLLTLGRGRTVEHQVSHGARGYSGEGEMISLLERSLNSLPRTDGVKKLVSGAVTPLDRFAVSERRLLIGIIENVRADLEHVSAVVSREAKGDDRALKLKTELAQSFVSESGVIPTAWTAYAAHFVGISSVVELLSNLSASYAAIERLMDSGDVNLQQVLRPKALVCALAQRSSECHGVPASALELLLFIADKSRGDPVPVNATRVSGVCVEGAEWDASNCYLKTTTSTETALPECYVSWQLRGEKSVVASAFKSSVYLPLYVGRPRGHLIAQVRVVVDPSVPHRTWRLRGTACTLPV